MTDYETEAQAVADAMNAVYENKQTNKKTSISGDYSTDNESYPTAKAVKDWTGTKVTSWSNTPADTNYPSEKLVKDSLDGKQATLVSGSNIKTINNNSILGSGNISIESGGTAVDIVTEWDSTLSDTVVPSEKLVKDTIDTKANATHSHSATEVADNNSANYTNLGTLSSNASQQTINAAIDSKLGSLAEIELVTVVAELPTASADTMNQLYLVAEATSGVHDNYEVYITVRTGTSGSYSYAWEKVDTARIDLSGYSTTSHGHGNIDKDGKIGSTSGLPLITTTGGLITTGSFSNTSGTFAEGNHAHNQITSDGKITSTAVTVASGDNIVITDASDSSKIKRVANLLASHVKDSNAHNNIDSSANDTQATINTKIDTALGNKISTSSTTGLVKNDGTIDTNTYLTSSSLSNYIQKSQTTGLIKNDGTIDTSTYLTQMKIGSTSGLPVKTTTNGVLTTGSFGTTAGTFAEGNHTHNYTTTSDVEDEIEAFATALANAINPSS